MSQDGPKPPNMPSAPPDEQNFHKQNTQNQVHYIENAPSIVSNEARSTSIVTPDGFIKPGEHGRQFSSLIKDMLKSVGALIPLFIVFFLNLIGAGFSGVLEFILASAGILGFLLIFMTISGVFTYISFKKFRFEFGEEEIRVRQGIINKRDDAVPYTRVHSVNIRQNLVDRILGLANVEFDTGAAATYKSVIIPGIKMSEAEAIKRTVFYRKKMKQQAAAEKQMQTQAVLSSVADQVNSAAPDKNIDGGLSDVLGKASDSFRGVFAGDMVEDPVQYERRLTNKELFLTGITNGSALVILFAVFGIVSQILQYVPVAFIDEEYVAHYMAIALANTGAVIAGLIFIFLLFWAISAVSVAFTYGGFVLKRREERIEITKGLINRTSRSISLNRVQSLEINQNIVMRFLKYAKVSVQVIDNVIPESTNTSTTSSSSEESNVVLHPFIKLDEIADLVENSIPEFSEFDDNVYRKLPLVSLRRTFIRGLMVNSPLFLLIVVMWVLHNFDVVVVDPVADIIAIVLITIVLVLIIGASFVARFLRFKNARVGHARNMLATVVGAVSLRTLFTPRNKIQSASVSQNIFQKRAGVATYNSVTAVQNISADANQHMRDMHIDDAMELLDWLRPRIDNVKEATHALNEAGLGTDQVSNL